MPRTRARLIASLLVVGALLTGGTAVAYRAIVERWGPDPRGTLIAAATVGISFFISMNLLLAWDERRRRRLGQTNGAAAAKTTDGPQVVADPTKKGA
jgi:hypothetical protein